MTHRSSFSFTGPRGPAGFALRFLLGLAHLLALAFLLGGFPDGARAQVSLPEGEGADMPEFTSTAPERWINSEPLKRAGLRGKVVLLEVWTSV